MQQNTSSYQSLLISRIPVRSHSGGYVTDPLWARDINANAQAVARVHLICPVVQEGDGGDAAPVNRQITVTAEQGLSDKVLEGLVQSVDVVELPGNFGWSASALSRRAMRLARQHGKLSVLGISSNRARTTLMNAAGRPPWSRARAWVRAQSIRLSQRHLASGCDAVRVVGPGLKELVAGQARTISVETASWITAADIRPPRSGQSDPVGVVLASRLEPMKGVAVGVDAVAGLLAQAQDIRLKIIGRGAEEPRLKAQVAAHGMEAQTDFTGQLPYPEPFFAALREADYVLLTNLNDEQPRLIFDAAAQGAIPVCPRHRAYLSLGLDDRVLYEQGSAEDLASCLRRLIAMPESDRMALRQAMHKVARSRTLEHMHELRRDWVLSLLAQRRGRAAPTGQEG